MVSPALTRALDSTRANKLLDLATHLLKGCSREALCTLSGALLDGCLKAVQLDAARAKNKDKVSAKPPTVRRPVHRSKRITSIHAMPISPAAKVYTDREKGRDLARRGRDPRRSQSKGRQSQMCRSTRDRDPPMPEGRRLSSTPEPSVSLTGCLSVANVRRDGEEEAAEADTPLGALQKSRAERGEAFYQPPILHLIPLINGRLRFCKVWASHVDTSSLVMSAVALALHSPSLPGMSDVIETVSTGGMAMAVFDAVGSYLKAVGSDRAANVFMHHPLPASLQIMARRVARYSKTNHMYWLDLAGSHAPPVIPVLNPFAETTVRNTFKDPTAEVVRSVHCCAPVPIVVSKACSVLPSLGLVAACLSVLRSERGPSAPTPQTPVPEVVGVSSVPLPTQARRQGAREAMPLFWALPQRAVRIPRQAPALTCELAAFLPPYLFLAAGTGAAVTSPLVLSAMRYLQSQCAGLVIPRGMDACDWKREVNKVIPLLHAHASLASVSGTFSLRLVQYCRTALRAHLVPGTPWEGLPLSLLAVSAGIELCRIDTPGASLADVVQAALLEDGEDATPRFKLPRLVPPNLDLLPCPTLPPWCMGMWSKARTSSLTGCMSEIQMLTRMFT
ncbi:hypothetical protein KIPB_000178 [Kipferlia bialata]|uniref:Uncharacterized protein n=1 Tax=Kipferlia bialata TaxID=797122 RepID=A0A9K3CM53_9EUKA|nr:hypothetical protein KIPB_000178 [Kipferlia bialata]|eukprot:g178.t1